MGAEHLHIVCLDAPAPANYGGAIDMFYKVKALAESGRKIQLHFFEYKSGRSAKGLEPYCASIRAYRRKGPVSSLLQGLPYIVGSRINTDLAEVLNRDGHPVLLEGIHCAGLLPLLRPGRKLLVRMHNDEAAYYAGLAQNEPALLKRLFFLRESRQLAKYQQQLPKDVPLACVAYNDIEVLRQQYGFTHLPFIPSFTPWQTLEGSPGRGTYCLYQGNLEVAENMEAARWLIREVFAFLPLPFVVAGKNIPEALVQAGAPFSHIRFVSNPDEAAMELLLREAHINVLPSFNTTGLKLKMLHALFAGRHCVANGAGVAGTAFDSAAEIAETPEAFRACVQALWEIPFTEEIRERRRRLADVYNNRKNAEALNAWL
ncbi:glycosyltransferase [Flaviaesturariibacter amylovorans]|uniref:Glycosyltransferase n=1 Tax=Flaviaesturariibacter amylovorans TaxID=1084520 RepID=A0ABP8GTJ0_9BACT